MDFASWDDESLRRAIRAGFTTRSDELAAEREALKRWLVEAGNLFTEEDVVEAEEAARDKGCEEGYGDGYADGRLAGISEAQE